MKIKKKEKKPEEPVLGYVQIFRYATCLEICATVLGVIFGLLSAGGICYNMANYGELSTIFVERTSYPEEMSSYLPLLELFGGGRRLQNASLEENMAALIEDGRALAVGTVVSVVISMVFCMLSVALVNWSALKQIWLLFLGTLCMLSYFQPEPLWQELRYHDGIPDYLRYLRGEQKMTRIRTKFLQSVMRQDMAWFDTDSEFNLASKMSENMMKLKDGMGEKLSIVANLVGTALMCIGTAFPLGWELALACGAVVPFSLIAAVVLSNYQTRSSVKEMDAYSVAGKQAEEVLKSVKTVVAYAGEEKEIERYRRLLQPAEQFGRKRGLYTGLGNGFNWVLTYTLNTIGLMYGSRLVVENMYKPADLKIYVVGDVFAVMFSMYMATQSITFCVPHMEGFAAARGAATSVFNLIEREPGIDSLQEGGSTPRRVIGDIALENVHFSYPSRPSVKVLHGFTLKVTAGENVALVGSSGCGKSTVLQLLQRLYDPNTGSVQLDGKDLRNLNLGWLRSSLGVVGQEPILFRGTIRENISIGCLEATMEEVQRVAIMAYAHDFITRLPNGYDTMIGERGASLSGGQKQRIAIARSLLREPAVLLLDEATSALDPHSERQVQAALDRASKGRTTLTVSHRLSTIVNADRIICMDQGSIVEQGTHDELMEAKGFYHKLVTRGDEVLEPDEIMPVPEEVEEEETLSPRLDIKRKSSRRTRRTLSSRKSSVEWIAARGSICSMMSTSGHSFGYNESDDDATEEDEEIKPVSSWQLMKLNAPEWPYLVTGSIAAFIQGACFPVFAILLGYTTAVFAYPDGAFIIAKCDLFAGLFILVAATAGVTMCLQSATFTSAGLMMTNRLREQYFSGLLRQEIGYFDKESNTVGAMCARLSGDAAEVQGATGLRIGLILQGFTSVFVGFIIAICYNWKLTLVGTALLPVMVGSIWLEGIISQQSQANERAAMESATAIATEAVIAIRTVQSLGVEKIFLRKFQENLAESTAAVAQKTRWRGLVMGAGVYVPFLCFSVAIVYGVTLIAYEGVPFSTVWLVTQSIMYGAYMLGQSLVYAPNFKSALDCGARILSLIHREPKIKTEPGVTDKKDWAATGNFSVMDVEFSYPTRPNQKVLRSLNLKVEAGKTVALVGSSGCGKSTILQLMQRFYDPISGNIELDGVHIKNNLTLPRLRRQLGVVQQEPVLFDRTLAENIAYGDNNRKVTMHEIVASAKAANIHNFIVSLPKGYDTNLGANGAQLSGGQKQRVCIARALIRAPRLLLLDEATSALDANSERTVSEALEKAVKGRTCISIAHRLSTIKDADLICVVDKGRIVERGTHSELIQQRGIYWRMCKGQHMA